MTATTDAYVAFGSPAASPLLSPPSGGNVPLLRVRGSFF